MKKLVTLASFYLRQDENVNQVVPRTKRKTSKWLSLWSLLTFRCVVETHIETSISPRSFTCFICALKLFGKYLQSTFVTGKETIASKNCFGQSHTACWEQKSPRSHEVVPTSGENRLGGQESAGVGTCVTWNSYCV